MTPDRSRHPRRLRTHQRPTSAARRSSRPLSPVAGAPPVSFKLEFLQYSPARSKRAARSTIS